MIWKIFKTPDSVLLVVNTRQLAAKTLTWVSIRLGRNTITHDINGLKLKYSYENPDEFVKARGAFKGGETAEGIPIEVFDRSGVNAVIDVGAHHGIYSVLMGKLNPNADLYVFEPADEPRKRLITNLELNDLLTEAVISNRVVTNSSNEEVLFREDPAPGSEKHGVAKKDGSDVVTKETTCLSDIFREDSISSVFLKIDAEGEEEQIVEDLVTQEVNMDLSGVIEIHPDKMNNRTQNDIEGLFLDNGFTLENFGDSSTQYEFYRPIYYFSNK
jgi:FkbM family methyltransferase